MKEEKGGGMKEVECKKKEGGRRRGGFCAPYIL